jgi:hypothetical protein
MKHMWIRSSWVRIASLLGLSILGVSAFVLLNDPQWRWSFRAHPPMPAAATALKVSHPSNEVQRMIQFEIDSGAAEHVQQFYRTELAKEGWRYRCTLDQPLNTSMEWMDVYERRTTQNSKGETLEIGIGKQSLQGREMSERKRVIWLHEWLTSLPPHKACA